MRLTTVGTVLGVRDLPARTDRTTGEVIPSRWKMLDLYDPEDGPSELRLSADAESPAPGSIVEVKVGVTAYSGFVNQTRSGEGVAGDAKIMFTALVVRATGPVAATSAEGAPSRSRASAK
jgi:hypothetical protein